MKDIGISMEQIALTYAILPFTIFLAPLVVEFMAKILGNFTRVLFLALLGAGLFHTSLLFIPTNVNLNHPPSVVMFSLVDDNGTLTWTPCNAKQIKVNIDDNSLNCIKQNNPENMLDIVTIVGANSESITFDLVLKSCLFTCPSDSIQLCESLTNMMICSENKDEDEVTLRRVSMKLMVILKN